MEITPVHQHISTSTHQYISTSTHQHINTSTMKDKPQILITNDDGIYAKGLNELIEVLHLFGNIIVVAPDSPRSGMSHGKPKGSLR